MWHRSKLEDRSLEPIGSPAGDIVTTTEDGARRRIVACCGGMVIVAGAERMTFEVLKALREQGASVHCIVNDWKNERIVELAESIGASWSTGFHSYTLTRTLNPLRIARTIWNVARTSSDLLRVARRLSATHVLLPEFGSALRNALALLVLRARGAIVVLRLSNAPDRGRFYDFLWRWVMPLLATRIVANSTFAAGRCKEAGIPSRKLSIVPNRVSSVLREDDDAELVARVASARTLLCVGQIAPFKGTHIAVAAALRLLERGTDVQLVIVGHEPDWPPDRVEYFRELVELVREKGFAHRVHFVGESRNVLELMKSSFLLLAPILQEETFGNVLLEALTAGLPVVAFPRGGIPELVEHEKTGYLCSTCDGDGLVEGIEYFLRSESAWRAAQAESRARCADPSFPYSSRAFARSWADMFSIDGTTA